MLYHVTREHNVEDKKLFYRFASHKELQTALDSYNALNKLSSSGPELVRYVALLERVRQFAGLDITEILSTVPRPKNPAKSAGISGPPTLAKQYETLGLW
jgi:hypothetical protein